MKIVIPVDEKDLNASVCESFGRAPYYAIFDTKKNEMTFIDNDASASIGGAGVKAAQKIVDNKVNVLLTPSCGTNAAEVLQAANIKIYKTTAIYAKDNLEAFISGKLDLLDEIHQGFHRHGGN